MGVETFVAGQPLHGAPFATVLPEILRLLVMGVNSHSSRALDLRTRGALGKENWQTEKDGLEINGRLAELSAAANVSQNSTPVAN
jgi:hypothetical protein